MHLRTVDPRLLQSNPANPRRTAPPALSDEQLAANIAAIGIIQPPLVRQVGDELLIIVGERRVKAAVAADQAEIPILVVDEDASDDRIRALSENVQRASMGPVDQWRAIEHAISDRWTEEAIATAMGLTLRTVRKLRLLAHIHPAILDQMAKGDMPEERVLRTIAGASREEQAAAWKRHKPKKGQTVVWWELARGLEKTRLSATIAKFGPAEEQAFGIQWEEDLFAPAGEDSRTTTQVEAFFAAQQAWLEANLPKKAVLLQTDQYGQPKLPPKAQQVYGKPGKGAVIGTWVNPRTAVIEEIAFRLPPKESKGETTAEREAASHRAKPDITKKGIALIGDMRTEALHQALHGTPIEDSTLLGLLVLAFAASNVSVQAPAGGFGSERANIARRLCHAGLLSADMDLLRRAARETLTEVLSCRVNASQSGIVARIAGETIGADGFLPNMAQDDVLSCLSKPALEALATSQNVRPRPRAKETRAAVIAHVGDGRFVLPAARFALSAEELGDFDGAPETTSDDDGETPEDTATEAMEEEDA